MRATVELDWGRVSYLEWLPDGPPVSAVVLLHGGGVDNASLSWGGLGPALAAAGHRVVAPDHPGFGHSPAPPWPATQANLVAYVGRFVEALRLDRYTIGGLSLGGGMAIGHVLDRPEKVSSAILLASYGIMPRLSDGPLSATRQALTCALVLTGVLARLSRWMASNDTALDLSMAALIRDPAQRTPALMAEVRAAVRCGGGFDEFAQWQRDQVGWCGLTTDYTPRLPTLAPPVLLIHGDRDTGVPVGHARAAAALIPDARLHIVAGAGHWVQRDRPAEVLAAITDFLRPAV